MPGEVQYSKDEADLLKAALALSFEEKGKYSLFFEQIAAKKHIAVDQAWKTYAVSGAAAVGTYLMMVGHIVEDVRDTRGILGTIELAKIQEYVNEHFTSNQFVMIKADIVMRDYGNGPLPILRPPFQALDAGTTFATKAGELPPPHLYLHGGIPFYSNAPDPPGWSERVSQWLGFQQTAADALRNSADVSPDAVAKLNKFIRDLEEKARITQSDVHSANPSGDASPIIVAEAPREKLDDLNDQYRDVVDLPMAPPAGEPVVAAASARALRAEPPPAGPSAPAFHRYLELRTWFLRRLRQFGEEQLSRVPPVPPYPGPGDVLGSYGFSHDKITEQSGAKTDADGEGPGGVFQALMRAVPELKAFHRVEGRKITNESALGAMLLGGRWRGLAETIAPGDLVKVADPMLPGGEGWLLALEATQRVVTKALTLYPGGNHFHMLTGNTGETTAAWNPIPQQILKPDSQVGRFWGPELARFRRLVADYLDVFRGSIALSSFVRDISAGTAYRANDFDGFIDKIGRELRYMDPRLPVYTGCILLTESDEELGVVLGDGTILGMSNRAAFGTPWRMSWLKFQPRYIWYPRLSPA